MVLSASCALCVFATGVDAASLTGSSPGYHYFWKAGATIEEHNDAVVDCQVATRALKAVAVDDLGTAAGASAGLIGALVGGIIDAVVTSYEERQGNAANVENCMAIKGWSVIGFGEAEGEAIRDLDDPEKIIDQIKPFVGAAAPPGPVLRGPFANELAVGNFIVRSATDLDKQSLSVRATKALSVAALEAAGDLKPPKPQVPEGLKAPKAVRGLKDKDVPAADPAKAYLVMRFVGKGDLVTLTSLSFERLNADGNEIVYDGAPVLAHIGYAKGRRIAKGETADGKFNDLFVEVPPGVWKLATIGNGLSTSSFNADLCFGAPAFEIKAGETIFLGVLTLRESGGYPISSSDLELARTIAAANPAIVERVKSPEWTNGFKSDCFGAYGYAYEIVGAPFFGGARSSGPARPEAALETPGADDAELITSPSQISAPQ